MRLSEEMESNQELSEVEVFRKFTAELMSLQKHLDPGYHTDQFLRDRILTFVELQPIQASLRDRLPRTSRFAINRVANQLSERKKSASEASACFTSGNWGDGSYYSLGRSCGGEARQNIKTPWRGCSGGKTHGTNGRRISTEWMRVVKGCFVCGKDHREITKHSHQEVIAEIEKLKAKHPSALHTVGDLSNEVNMAFTEDEETKDDTAWDKDKSDGEGDISVHLAASDGKEVEEAIANNAFLHGAYLVSSHSALITMTYDRSKAHLKGVLIDTAANRKSVMSEIKYAAYQREFGRKVPMRPARRVITGIGGIGKVIGEALIQITIVELKLVIDVTFSILEKDVPSLLCNKDMVENGLDLSIQGPNLHIGELHYPLIMHNYFLIYKWSDVSIPYVLYTERKLRSLHRSFGHPSAMALYLMLKRVRNEKPKRGTQRLLVAMERQCRTCQNHAPAPRLFKLTIGCEDLRFNHSVIADTMYIDNRPVLHSVDEATHFMAECFLKTESSKSIWKGILSLGCRAYMGPSDFLSVDQGSAYVSREFKRDVEPAGITLKKVPIESPGSIGVVERYHAPLDTAYKKIRESISAQDETDAKCLSMATFAYNSELGPEGLVPMLLVFGAVPRPARTEHITDPVPTAACYRERTGRRGEKSSTARIAFALRHPAGPKAIEQSEKLRALAAGSPVLIYRTTMKHWEGPFRFISIEGKTVAIQLPHGRRTFRSTYVKPFQQSGDHKPGPCTDRDTDGKEKTEGREHIKDQALKEPLPELNDPQRASDGGLSSERTNNTE